jgi:tRNA(Ile)-lysidine synthase TilS/MesJ
MSDDLKEQYKTGTPQGEKALHLLIESIKKQGKQKKYDCVVGVSGGTDSSFTLAKVVEWGLRPLAVHFDNTWNSAIATENIKALTQKLNVDLFTYVVNNKEMDDITRSFFYADVPELDCPTDIALAETLYRAAAKFKVKYILEGHSFIAEGISPMGTNYFDGKYIKDIHKKFGATRMKTFPNMTFISFMKWVAVMPLR